MMSTSTQSPILQKSLKSRPTTATSRNTDGSQMDRVYNEHDEDDTAANHFRTTNKDSHNRKVVVSRCHHRIDLDQVLVTPDSFLPKEGRIPGYTGFQPGESYHLLHPDRISLAGGSEASLT